MAELDRSRLLRRLGRFNDLAAEAALRIATVLLLVLLVLNAAVVGVRYGFGVYGAWILEISRILMIYIVFLGAVYLYRKRQHVAVSLIVDMLANNSALKRFFQILCESTVLVFASVVLWQAVIYQPILFQRLTAVLRLPENITSIGVPIAYLLILLSSIETIFSPQGARK